MPNISNNKVHVLGLLPIFLSAGILIYFNTEDSIAFLQIGYVFLANLACLILAKRYLRKYKFLWVIFFISLLTILGYASTIMRVNSIPTLQLNVANIKAEVMGTVEEIEIKGVDKKLLLRDVKLTNSQNPPQLNKVKIVVRTELKNVEKNDLVIVNASLMPPPDAILPGGFDYSRFAFFQGISAVGYAIDNVKIVRKCDRSKLPWIARIEAYLFDNIYANVEEKYAAIAVALFLGDYKKIDTKTYDEIRISGIAHLLSISGTHISLVAALIFFVSNLVFSRIYHPDVKIHSKKISALITVCICLFYLLLANSPVPAQRAFTMAALIFVGILIDRKTTSLRAVSFAALIILIFMPEALLSASLQMSFSASLSLIYGAKLLKKTSLLKFDSKTSGVVKLYKYFLSITLAGIFATLATSPFIMFHFKNFSTYSVITNLLAIPLTEFIIMPFGILGMMLIPFNLEFIGYYPMELGIMMLLEISRLISLLPYALIKINKVNDLCLFTCVLGCVLPMVLRGKLRYVCLIFFTICLYEFFTFKLPDIAVGKNGNMVAVKDLDDGQLYLISGFREKYAKKIWEQELMLKKMDKKDLKKVCKHGLCIIPEHKLFVVFYDEHLESACEAQDNKKIFINLTQQKNYTCDNGAMSINRMDLENNGSHIIWVNNDKSIAVKHNGDYQFSKPWVNKFH